MRPAWRRQYHWYMPPPHLLLQRYAAASVGAQAVFEAALNHPALAFLQDHKAISSSSCSSLA